VSKELLFSITAKDLRVDYFSGSGAGGQKRNKCLNSIRISHIPSGAVGQSQDERSQTQNKKKALERLVDNPKFKSWVRVEAAARLQGFRDVEHKVETMLKEKNLLIEVSSDGEDWHKPGETDE